MTSAITISPSANTSQATDVSHSTLTAHSRPPTTSGYGSLDVTFDYWAFTANRERYLLSYSRKSAAKTPDAAPFFTTATSCAK